MTHAEALSLLARARTHLSIVRCDNATKPEKLRRWLLEDVGAFVEMFEEILAEEARDQRRR